MRVAGARRRTALGAAMGVALSMASGPAGGAPGDTTLLPWRGGAKAAVSITMDDGYVSQRVFMRRLLEDRGFRGTFYVVTSWLDDEDQWEAWRPLSDGGHEIGSHSVTHVALDALAPEALAQEVQTSREAIVEHFGATQGRSLAFPFSKTSPAAVAAVAAAGYQAARTGLSDLNPPSPDDLFLVRSLHPLSDTEATEIQGWIDLTLDEGAWLVVGVHGLRDPDEPLSPTQEGWEPVPVAVYAAALDHLAALGPQVWVAPLVEVADYVRARDAALVEPLPGPPGEIHLRVTGQDAPVPLEVEVEVPSQWEVVRLEVADDMRLVSPSGQDRRVVRFSATPPAEVAIIPVQVTAPSPVGADTQGDGPSAPAPGPDAGTANTPGPGAPTCAAGDCGGAPPAGCAATPPVGVAPAAVALLAAWLGLRRRRR